MPFNFHHFAIISFFAFVSGGNTHGQCGVTIGQITYLWIGIQVVNNNDFIDECYNADQCIMDCAFLVYIGGVE
ncbi:MAG: hypothetical protein H0V39_06400 [Nitrosomonas sp.]|nr:hypothetical protein [Nitrosomonas sp.]